MNKNKHESLIVNCGIYGILIFDLVNNIDMVK